MLEQVRKFFLPPVFPNDEDKTRRARYANAIMLAFLAVLILFETFIRVSENYTDLSFIDLIMVGLAVLFLTGLVLLRKGRVQLTSILLVVLVWLASNGLAVGTTVRTEYKRVRIDPETLTVDISDQTYALSSGKATLNGVEVTSMPLGVAMACDGDTTWATSMMSLRDTPFVITTKYVTAGTAAAGNSDPWSDEQTVEGWAHGACGYLAPAGMAGMPINTLEDGFVLKLDWKK